MSFEWQTEEEFSWDNEPKAEPKPSKPPRRWRRWLLVLLFLMVLMAGGAWYAYRQLNERIEAVNERTQAEILASHDLIQTAAFNRDTDLFISFLSGREPEWAFGAEEAVRRGAFLDRPSLGLVRQPAQMEPTVQNISADLTAAEVVYEQTYAIDIGNGLTETITLDQIDIYRLGPNRWLLAPPEPDFWGENLVHRGTRLHLNYPERDKEIGRRLAVDLDEKLQEACNRLAGLDCPTDLIVQAYLTANPGTLATNFNADALVYNLDDLRLPAPSLVGLPQDEQGYQVLLRGYARQMVSALLASTAGWTCCRHVHVYQPLLDFQLAQLGLQPWPLTAAHYSALVAAEMRFAGLEALWEVDSGTRELERVLSGYALVEFLATAVPNFAPAERQAALMRQPNQRLVEWVLNGSNGRFADIFALERRFYQFIYEQAEQAEQAAPQPLPSQQLLALCHPVAETELALYRYDADAGAAELLRRTRSPLAFMLALPDDNGAVVSEERVVRTSDSYTYIWQNGREIPIVHNDFDALFPLRPLFTDPTNSRLVLRVGESSAAPFAFVSLPDCLAGAACVAEALLGYPYWSPAGTRTLARRTTEGDPEFGQGLLFSGNEAVRQLDFFGEGTAPFWLSETEVGYVLNGQTVQTRLLPGAIPETLFTTADLLNSLSADERPSGRSLIIDFVQPYAHDPDRLLVIAIDPNGRLAQHYFFSYQLETGEVVLEQTEPANRIIAQRGYRFSPSGRWLLLSQFDGGRWQLMLYDTVNYQLRPLLADADLPLSAERYADWSADEQWLVLPENGVVRLLLLDGSGYERPLFLTEGGCETAVWVNR